MTLLLVSQSSNLTFSTPSWQGLDKTTSWSLPRWETQDISTITFDTIKHACLAKEWNSFHFLGKNLEYFHLKESFDYDYGLCLKQLLTSPQHITIVAYRTLNHRLVVETGQRSTTIIFRDKWLCQYDMNMQLKLRHTLCWSVPQKEIHER